jgi:hypothetical protein
VSGHVVRNAAPASYDELVLRQEIARVLGLVASAFDRLLNLFPTLDIPLHRVEVALELIPKDSLSLTNTVGNVGKGGSGVVFCVNAQFGVVIDIL